MASDARGNNSRAHRPVTIIDVAREAGVSYATVSRVINTKSSIVADKRERVLAAMQRLGYVPNMQARKLAGGRSQVIGLVLHDVWSSYVVEILRGVDEELAAGGYDLMLYTSRQRVAQESEHVASLTQGFADGLLLLLPRGLNRYLEQLHHRQFPIVLIDHDAEGKVPSVAATNFQGAVDATKYLIELGHRRIGFITGDLDVGAARDRLAGYRAALAENNIPFDPELVAPGDFFEPRAIIATQRLLTLPRRPTAIFSSNDVSAFGVLRAATDLGLSIPDDVSLVGFDGIPQSAYMHPPLTTVRQPLEEMGRVAARLLMQTIRDPQRSPERQELSTQLIVRASCAAPKEVTQDSQTTPTPPRRRRRRTPTTGSRS